jgi:hypothetical protein
VESTATCQSKPPAASASGEEAGVDHVPRPVRAEPAVPLPYQLPRPEYHRQVTPGDPGPEPVDDALDHLAMITERAPTLSRRGRHQRFDPIPILICHDGATRHHTTITDSPATFRRHALASTALVVRGRWDRSPRSANSHVRRLLVERPGITVRPTGLGRACTSGGRVVDHRTWCLPHASQLPTLPSPPV